jgi:DNA/RNA endonuclease G (NUC1)
MKLTFSYANCALQNLNLNRGLWASLENKERKWSQTDSLIVTINVYFDAPVKRLPTGTAIPKAFLKTIYFSYSKQKLIYYFPNTTCNLKLEDYLQK